MQHGNFETIDLSKALFHVLGFLTVDVSSPFYTIVESVDDREARGVCFGFMKDIDNDHERIPADFTVVDVTSDVGEPDITKMTTEDVKEFDDYLFNTIERELTSDNFKLIDWVTTEHHTIAGETVLMTGYIARVTGCERQYVAIRRRLANRNICIIGTFDVQRSDDFMNPIMEMLGRVRAMTYHS
jgi:hypothetical protein